jgi:hypothetical protein
MSIGTRMIPIVSETCHAFMCGEAFICMALNYCIIGSHTATGEWMLALTLEERSDLDGAHVLAGRWYEIAAKVFGENHATTLAAKDLFKSADDAIGTGSKIDLLHLRLAVLIIIQGLLLRP